AGAAASQHGRQEPAGRFLPPGRGPAEDGRGVFFGVEPALPPLSEASVPGACFAAVLFAGAFFATAAFGTAFLVAAVVPAAFLPVLFLPADVAGRSSGARRVVRGLGGSAGPEPAG